MSYLVVIESPFAGDIERNLDYLRRCVLNCLSCDENPIASHGFFPQFLDDNDPVERELGIQLGYEWAYRADYVIFFIDLGWSSGMIRARELYDKLGVDYELRRLEE